MRIRTRNIKRDESFEAGPETASALPEGAFFLLIALMILLCGLNALYSTSFVRSGMGLFMKQLIWTGVGMVFFLGTVLLGHKTLTAFSPVLFFLLILLLLLPLTLLRHKINGAYRWIVLGPLSLQPSEFAKVVMVLFWADFLSRHTRAIEARPLSRPFLKVFVPMGLSLAAVVLLIMLGSDLGTSALICAVFFAMLYAGGMPLMLVLPLPLLAVFGFLGINIPAVQTFLFKTGILTQYRLSRLTSYINPEIYADREGYQLWVSQLALGSGGWFGLGFTESRFKRDYLPEDHTDFILSIVGEELGFAFLLAVIAAYVLLFFTGLLISHKARTRQGMLTAFGMSLFIGLQALINIGVICGAFPTKGMPAPLISYGGSNLVTCLAAIGIVFSVALDNSYPDYPETLRRKWREFVSGKEKNTRRDVEKTNN